MTKDDATWLKMSYIIFALIVGFVVSRAIDTIGVQTGWSDRYSEWFPTFSILASVAIGALSALWLGRDQSRHDYFLASIAELRKVTWPTALDTRRMTIVVCVVVGIFAIILAVFDFVWAKALKALLV